MNESYQKAVEKVAIFHVSGLCLSLNYVFIALRTFVIWKPHLVNTFVCSDIACSCQGIESARSSLLFTFLPFK